MVTYIQINTLNLGLWIIIGLVLCYTRDMEINKYNIRIYKDFNKFFNDSNKISNYIYSDIYINSRIIESKWFGIRIYKRYGKGKQI